MLQKAPVSMDQLQRLLQQPLQYPYLPETDVEDFVIRLQGTFDNALPCPLLCTQVAVLKAYPQPWQLCLHLLVLSSLLQHVCLLLAHLCTRQTDLGSRLSYRASHLIDAKRRSLFFSPDKQTLAWCAATCRKRQVVTLSLILRSSYCCSSDKYPTCRGSAGCRLHPSAHQSPGHKKTKTQFRDI